ILQSLQNLESSLECVNHVMQRLWKSSFDNIFDNMTAILSLSPDRQNFMEMLKKFCDIGLIDLANISFLANGDDKNIRQFKAAMTQGNKNSKLILEILNTTWHYDKIDRILLGVRKSELNEIGHIIGQFEECKEISAVQIEFWKQGGRVFKIDDDENIICANLQMSSNFKNCKDLWKKRLINWKQCYLQLRENFPALNYFRLPFLQKVNCKVTNRNVDEILHNWRKFDPNMLTSYDTCATNERDDLKKCRDDIAKIYPVGLHIGKPNLILSQDKLLLFKVLGLFESQPYIPRAEHILICNEKTMEKDVACLIFRDISNDIQMHHDSVKSLYCLVYPEELTLVHDLLLNDVQLEKLKNCFYLFAVISSDAENPLCKLLEPFHLYTLERVGMGKSRVIQRDIEKIQSIHRQKGRAVKDVCVTFNGIAIDWEQTMDSLWSYYPCSDDSLIIDHLNILSCVSTQINDFLFQLLFLQHIDSNSQISQCFHVNSNMRNTCGSHFFSWNECLQTSCNFFYQEFFFNDKKEKKMFKFKELIKA
ncbi:hypothetical protein RFI_29564, partial [Reticulomyxa filosa]